MKRRLMVFAALAVAALAAALLYRCRRDGDFILGGRLSNLIEHAGDGPFAIATATDFEWETLHVFGPYTPNEDVAPRLGFPWSGSIHVDMQMRDDAVLLVFVRSRKVVAYVAHPRGSGDFSVVPMKNAYTPDTAVFRRREHRGWLCLDAVHPTLQVEQAAINRRRWPGDVPD